MQTKHRTQSRFSEIADERFNYDLTEERYYYPMISPDHIGRKGTDYYRSPDCRYMLCVVNEPIEEESSNIIVIDAAQGGMAYDSTVPTIGNCVLSARLDADQFEAALDMLKIPKK
jgi:hypothetical protein